MSRPIHMCGRSRVYIPETECSDCDKALYLIDKIIDRLDNMSFKAFRGSYQGTGALITTASVQLENYEYSDNDTFLVFMNGLNLTSDEFDISGSGDTVTVTLRDPASMQPVDILEVVALKFDNGASESSDDDTTATTCESTTCDSTAAVCTE